MAYHPPCRQANRPPKPGQGRSRCRDFETMRLQNEQIEYQQESLQQGGQTHPLKARITSTPARDTMNVTHQFLRRQGKHLVIAYGPNRRLLMQYAQSPLFWVQGVRAGGTLPNHWKSGRPDLARWKTVWFIQILGHWESICCLPSLCQSLSQSLIETKTRRKE